MLSEYLLNNEVEFVFNEETGLYETKIVINQNPEQCSHDSQSDKNQDSVHLAQQPDALSHILLENQEEIQLAQ